MIKEANLLMIIKGYKYDISIEESEVSASVVDDIAINRRCLLRIDFCINARDADILKRVISSEDEVVAVLRVVKK